MKVSPRSDGTRTWWGPDLSEPRPLAPVCVQEFGPESLGGNELGQVRGGVGLAKLVQAPDAGPAVADPAHA